MKIAYIGIKGLPSKGGAERVVEAIVNRLKNRHEFAIYASSSYTPKDFHLPGSRLFRIPCLLGKHSRSLSLFILSAFHAFLFGKYDLIHVHNAEACFVTPLLKLRYPVIATSHGPAYERAKWNKFAKTLIRCIDYFFVFCPKRITSVSLPVATDYESNWAKKIEYIPNGTDLNPVVDRERAAETLAAHDISGKYLLFAADRLDRTKGCHSLLEAFSQIKTSLKLVVIGNTGTDPAYSEELFRIADSRVCFVPFIREKAQFFGVLQQAQILIFPSTVEAMSMVLLEAASLGTSILCSDIPANTAALSEHALYFKSSDVRNLREKLSWAISHPGEMKEKGLRAREWVRKHFDWDVIAARYEKLYWETLNDSRAKRKVRRLRD